MADAPLMRLTTQPAAQLGRDALRFRSMKAREELARVYQFEVTALADEPSIATAELLGKWACVTVELPDDSERHFHGLVCAMGVAGELEGGVAYKMVLRPWLWLLTRRADIRVFQNKTAEDIAKEVFDSYGVNDYKFDLSGKLPKYEYCVQYRETDFSFVSRLFEREGIYYYFRHEAEKHVLVVVDSASKHSDCPGHHEFRWRGSSDRGLDEEVINEWHGRRELQAGKWTLKDFNYETPKVDLLRSAQSAIAGASAVLEIYDYPGQFPDASAGLRYAGLRSDETDARHRLVEGAGALRTVACGYKFKCVDHPDTVEREEHLVLATEIELESSGYESGAGEDSWRCRFSAVPISVPFRPERITPKPIVAGPHTATVVGPKGEEIFVDELGRVKLRFHWDRLSKNHEESSCYVRVAQGMAGNGWGMVWLPRIGQEVVVDFLEGDPDRPLVTGSVYNVSEKTPYKLPDHKTVSTIKSRSSKDGGATSFNELRFEDEKGKEYLLMQAQKDKIEFVKETTWTEIGKDEHRTVKGDRRETIEGGSDMTVKKDVKQKVDGKLSLEVANDMLLKGGGVHALKAAKDITSESGTAYSIKAGTDMHVKLGTNLGVDAGINVHLKGGVNVVIEAGVTMTLKAGASSVVIGPDGVSVTGAMVKINSGGAPGAGGGASPVAPSPPEAPTDPEPPKDPLEHR